MTKKDKQLLLKDLCARLSYGVKVQNIVSKEIYDLNDYLYCLPTAIVTNFKPYLRPMSSMTEEEKEEYKKIVPGIVFTDGINLPHIPHVDWLNKNMFDYRGLIPKGLALEATKDMYKK